MDERRQLDRSSSPRGAFCDADDTAAVTANDKTSPSHQFNRQDIVDDIQTAAFSDQKSNLTDVIETYLAAGIARVDLCETFIPEAARSLGAQWCDDTLSFAGVTIGCSRLVKELRDLECDDAGGTSLNAPQVLLLVADDVYHTLGATVLSGILRRAGLGVQLWIGATANAVRDYLRHSDYDAVLLSASTGESLDSLRRLITAAKLDRQDMLTIVGGTIIESVGSAEDVARLTGADHATIDIDLVVKLCQQAAQSATHFQNKPHSTSNSVTRLQVR